MQLSEHFSLDEMTRSATALRLGYNNTPDKTAIDNMALLCDTLLEPIRSMLGVPMHIDSGFRSKDLNAAVKGAKHSAHMEGRAADFIPTGAALLSAFDAIRRSSLPFDQVIIECGAWIHIAIAPLGAKPRRQALVASGKPGAWRYTEVVDA